MKFSPKLLILVLFAELSFSFTSYDEEEIVPNDIVSIVNGDTNFSTLVAALTKTDLVTTLQGAWPFTVFAPNNVAFTKASIASLDNFTKEALTIILTSHLVSGRVEAAVARSGRVPTVNSANNIYLSKNPSWVFINGKIKVTQTDITKENGIIHMIYDMIIPPSLSLVQIATGNANFHELVFLVLAAGPAVAAALTNANAAG